MADKYAKLLYGPLSEARAIGIIRNHFGPLTSSDATIRDIEHSDSNGMMQIFLGGRDPLSEAISVRDKLIAEENLQPAEEGTLVTKSESPIRTKDDLNRNR